MTKKIFKTALPIVLMIIISSISFAATNTYAKNFGEWLLDGLFWAIIIAGIWYAYKYMAQRNIIAGIGIILTTAFFAYLVKNPTVLSNLGSTLKGIIGL